MLSANDATKRREALEELMQSEGWQVFRGHVLAEWQGKGYVNRMGLALAKDPTAPQVVHGTALEIVRLLEWPGTQVRDLKGSIDHE